MSKYIIGNDRNQFELFCIEERIGRDNEVRLIDLFVDSLPLSEYGFVDHKENPLGGRPAKLSMVLSLKMFVKPKIVNF